MRDCTGSGAALVTACALLASCGAAPRTPAADPSVESRGSGANPAAVAPGLTLERWFVPADPAAREAGLASARGAALIDELASGISSSGFTAYRAKRADLGKVQAALGGTYQVHSTLLGELPEWADIDSARVEPGRTIFVSGRPRTAGEQVLRLWLRGWTFPTVDSGRARIEWRLTLEDVRGERLTLDPTAPRNRAREIEGSRTVAELAPDEAMILVERPIVPPDADEAGELAVTPPPQLAALLLSERGIEGRATVLIVTAGFVDILPARTEPAQAPQVQAPQPPR